MSAPAADAAGLALVPIHLDPSRTLLGRLARSLAGTFSTQVEVVRPWFDPERAFDPARGQYNSTVLLALLQAGPREAAAAGRVLGVTSADLFLPVLSYVFGEAQLAGRAAVVSLHRLAAERYGLPADEALLERRAEIEAVHELGHTFGLVHCRQPECVMRSSTYVEEIDLKPARFCAGCQAALAQRISPGPPPGP